MMIGPIDQRHLDRLISQRFRGVQSTKTATDNNHIHREQVTAASAGSSLSCAPSILPEPAEPAVTCSLMRRL
jgi:hypothetical protein